MKTFRVFLRRWRRAALLVPVWPGLARAQGNALSLRAALDQAAQWAVTNRIARATRDGSAAGTLAARRSMFPALRLEAGFARTTDPVGAFGTTLRQQRVTPDDFHPDRLNFPPPIDNFSGAVVVEQPVMALDGWLAARAAARGTESATFAVEWAAVTTEAEVISAWYGVILAAERASTVTAATRAAEAHVRQAERMLSAGLVTKSDALLASARAGELESARLNAVQDSLLAGRHLAALIGLDAGQPAIVRGGFPGDSVLESTAREVRRLGSRSRADIETARASHAAAIADVSRARATMVPRVVSFARRDMNSTRGPLTGASNWTVGVMASWTLFTGASELADHRGAEARKAAAQARLAGAEASAAVDVERRALTLDAAVSRLAISRQTVEHAQEAHRIVVKKYAGGLATVVELLDAAAIEMQARLSLSGARHGLIMAMAEHLRATGHEPGRLAVLDDGVTATR